MFFRKLKKELTSLIAVFFNFHLQLLITALGPWLPILFSLWRDRWRLCSIFIISAPVTLYFLLIFLFSGGSSFVITSCFWAAQVKRSLIWYTVLISESTTRKTSLYKIVICMLIVSPIDITNIKFVIYYTYFNSFIRFVI